MTADSQLPTHRASSVAADGLATLAAGRGDEAMLNYLIDAGNALAADLLAERVAAAGDLEALQRLADEGSEVAAKHISRIIGETESS